MESPNGNCDLLGTGQLVTCRLDELHAHPSYVRHHLAVPASQLSALAERGDRAFLEPLVITQDRTILDGPLVFNPIMASQPLGCPVVRHPEHLRMHHALEELGPVGVIDEINKAARLKEQPVLEPILITRDGTILAGFGRWRLALFEGRREIDCIEYPLNEDESLPFILAHHRPARGWNAFVRIRLALTLEPYLQQKAFENMRAGGKYKGWANLPEAQHINVRQEIANAAGVGARNVSSVKRILETAHSRLLEALRDGTLTINRAMHFCKLPRTEQLEQLTRYSEERAIKKVIRQFVTRPKQEENSPDAVTVLDTLQQQEARQPGSVVMRVGRLQRTVVLIGRDLLTGPHSQKELKLA